MRHIMLDLETMGTSPGAAILSIGACVFNPVGDDITETFKQSISLADSLTMGFKMDASTVLWWVGQSEEARVKMLKGQNDSLLCWKALVAFTNFVLPMHVDKKDVAMWGNGAAFDNVLLTEYYRALSQTKPWLHFNDRCYRTIKSQMPDVKLIRVGTFHDPLDDAISQAKHLQALALAGALIST